MPVHECTSPQHKVVHISSVKGGWTHGRMVDTWKKGGHMEGGWTHGRRVDVPFEILLSCLNVCMSDKTII